MGVVTARRGVGFFASLFVRCRRSATSADRGYVLLTVLLAGVYAAGVFLLRPAVSQMTGESTLSVAISTVAVAALFGRPVAGSRRLWIAASTARVTTRHV